MRVRYIIALFTLISAICGGFDARAEEQTPGFSMPGAITPDDVNALSVDFDEAFNTIENQYLADTLKLNYQISLLEKMVARQAELEKISESYEAMGIHFEPPAPPRGICAQLPANAPCLKYHPDLYATLVDARKSYYEELARKARQAAEPERKEGETDKEMEARRAKEAAEKKRIAAIKERDNRYRWTDVSCFSGKCHGVLVNANMDGYRATVHEGDSLADGTKVQEISTRGIRVSIDGQSVKVRPAPGEGTDTSSGADPLAAALAAQGMGGSTGAAGAATGGAAGATAAQSAAASVIANAKGGATQATGAAAPFSGGTAPVGTGVVSPPAATGGNTGAGQSTMEPALGPSGLF